MKHIIVNGTHRVVSNQGLVQAQNLSTNQLIYTQPGTLSLPFKVR